MSEDRDHVVVEELRGAFALDALDPEERRLVERHLEACPRCLAEVQEHREVAALFLSSADRPPEGLWDRIVGELAPEAPSYDLAPIVPIEARSRASSRRLVGWGWAAAAAVILALTAGLALQSARIADLSATVGNLQTDPLQQAVSAALQDPTATVASLTGVDASTGNILAVVLPDGTGYLLQSSLSPLPETLTYQLWAVVDGKVISAGVLGNRPGIVPFRINSAALEALVITQEVSGGVERSENEAVVSWFDA